MKLTSSSFTMRLLSVLTLAGCAAASNSHGTKRSAVFNELTGIMERQLRICDSVPIGPNFCERSCGTGYVSCVNFSTCYNPTRGDVCCSDGSKCQEPDSSIVLLTVSSVL